MVNKEKRDRARALVEASEGREHNGAFFIEDHDSCWELYSEHFVKMEPDVSALTEEERDLHLRQLRLLRDTGHIRNLDEETLSHEQRFHPFKIIKAMKDCEIHANYWPEPGDARFILKALNDAEFIALDFLELSDEHVKLHEAVRDLVRAKRDGEPIDNHIDDLVGAWSDDS